MIEITLDQAYIEWKSFKKWARENIYGNCRISFSVYCEEKRKLGYIII